MNRDAFLEPRHSALKSARRLLNVGAPNQIGPANALEPSGPFLSRPEVPAAFDRRRMALLGLKG